jgi:hypothetical protein
MSTSSTQTGDTVWLSHDVEGEVEEAELAVVREINRFFFWLLLLLLILSFKKPLK